MKRNRLMGSACFHVSDLGAMDSTSDAFAALCDLVWQGDLGKGQSTGSGVFSDPGANPCTLYGPQNAAGVSNQGVPQPQWRLGMVVAGDLGTEFVYAKLALAAVTDLMPGQAYQLDKDYNATLLTTANSVLNEEVVFLNVFQPAVAVGTYFAFFARAGRLAVQAVAASIATGFGETTATAGSLKFTTLGQTAGTKSVAPASAYGASSSITFTATTVNGSPTLLLVQSVSGGAADPIRDLTPGMVFTGTAGIPANAIIAAIRKQNGGWVIDIGTNTAGAQSVLQNATANGVAIVMTVTSHVVANVDWPTLAKQN